MQPILEFVTAKIILTFLGVNSRQKPTSVCVWRASVKVISNNKPVIHNLGNIFKVKFSLPN